MVAKTGTEGPMAFWVNLFIRNLSTTIFQSRRSERVGAGIRVHQAAASLNAGMTWLP